MLQPASNRVDPSVRSMIDAYIAQGLHQRVPATDVRLKPTPRRLDWNTLTPGADASSVYRASRSTKDRKPVAHENWPPLESVVETVGDCPSAPGSSRAARFGIMTPGATLETLRRQGLRLSDLCRYLGAGVVTLTIPGSAAAAQESGE